MNLRQKIRKRRNDLQEGKFGLERKITELEALLEQAKINFYATDGGIQECDRILNLLEDDDETKDVGV